MSITESIQYIVLGVMITGGIAATVAGSRMLQGMLSTAYVGNVGMPTGLLLVISGSVSLGVSAGYLMRDIQSEDWEDV